MSCAAFLKLYALGIIFPQDAYFRDGWNILDFVLVVLAFVPYIIPGVENFTALRVVRASDGNVEDRSARFRGYRLDASGEPTFRYELDGAEVEERVELAVAPALTIARAFRVSGLEGAERVRLRISPGTLALRVRLSGGPWRALDVPTVDAVAAEASTNGSGSGAEALEELPVEPWVDVSLGDDSSADAVLEVQMEIVP